MAKPYTTIGGWRSRTQSKNRDTQTIDIDKALIHTQNTVSFVTLATLQTLVDDFGFDEEKLNRFQELMQGRFRSLINGLKSDGS